MNQFIITGRTTKDTEVRYTTEGKAVARFDFAVNRTFKREGEPDADFFSCVAFGKTAEAFEKCRVLKGTKIIIDGEVQNDNYTKQDGTKAYGTKILINSFAFCESKQAKDDVPTFAPNSPDGFMSIPDGLEMEELPFN
jgi:single-strand DNA-binding protein